MFFGTWLSRPAPSLGSLVPRSLNILSMKPAPDRMRAGGTRRFKASPHLCYRDEELAALPKHAVLIFDIKSVEVLAS
jgi:hypothetical protein